MNVNAGGRVTSWQKNETSQYEDERDQQAMRGDGKGLNEEQSQTMAQDNRREPYFLKLRKSDTLVNVLAKRIPDASTENCCLVSCTFSLNLHQLFIPSGG